MDFEKRGKLNNSSRIMENRPNAQIKRIKGKANSACQMNRRGFHPAVTPSPPPSKPMPGTPEVASKWQAADFFSEVISPQTLIE
jgi:hypothetical protein